MASSSGADDFKEVLWPQNGLVYDQEFMLPAYCKPKLIPLKTVTLEKLEKMQSENVERLREMERAEAEQQEKEESEKKATMEAAPGSSTVPPKTQPDIWRADADN